MLADGWSAHPRLSSQLNCKRRPGNNPSCKLAYSAAIVALAVYAIGFALVSRCPNRGGDAAGLALRQPKLARAAQPKDASRRSQANGLLVIVEQGLRSIGASDHRVRRGRALRLPGPTSPYPTKRPSTQREFSGLFLGQAAALRWLGRKRRDPTGCPAWTRGPSRYPVSGESDSCPKSEQEHPFGCLHHSHGVTFLLGKKLDEDFMSPLRTDSSAALPEGH